MFKLKEEQLQAVEVTVCRLVGGSGLRLTKNGSMYGLLTKCEVKMPGYWPSSFFECLWTETKSRFINSQKKNEANIQPS